MAPEYTFGFAHRPNRDGTIDSICRRCYVTVATAVSEMALSAYEEKHVCDQDRVARFRVNRHAARGREGTWHPRSPADRIIQFSNAVPS